ncbi:MAG: peptidase M23 [Gammaproteobacteria bacterium]|nr:MAG: peptidase M23 [Gammaproteobacteria bacterium]
MALQRLLRRSQTAWLVCLTVTGLLLLVACVPQTSGYGSADGYGYHTVRSGETLFEIAWKYGKDHHDLARWNKLGNGSLIYPGQKLRLTPPTGSSASTSTTAKAPVKTSRAPARKPDQPSPAWDWPTKGPIEAEFDGRAGYGSGLLIGGKRGQAVRAAASGRVVYSGGGLIGYGELIIVKHNDTYLSAYGHNASVLVKEGDTIKKGQRIATMGEGPGLEPRLHFEIRRNGEPVDPRRYLPAR